jgi:hypothetical protein
MALLPGGRERWRVTRQWTIVVDGVTHGHFSPTRMGDGFAEKKLYNRLKFLAKREDEDRRTRLTTPSTMQREVPRVHLVRSNNQSTWMLLYLPGPNTTWHLANKTARRASRVLLIESNQPSCANQQMQCSSRLFPFMTFRQAAARRCSRPATWDHTLLSRATGMGDPPSTQRLASFFRSSASRDH